MSGPTTVFEGGAAGSRQNRLYLHFLFTKYYATLDSLHQVGWEIMQHHKYSRKVSDLHWLCFGIHFDSDGRKICYMPGHLVFCRSYIWELCCAQGPRHVPGGLLANQQRGEQRRQQRDANINTNGGAAA